MAGGEGFEPPLAESESAVLPLDDPPSVSGKSPCPGLKPIIAYCHCRACGARGRGITPGILPFALRAVLRTFKSLPAI